MLFVIFSWSQNWNSSWKNLALWITRCNCYRRTERYIQESLPRLYSKVGDKQWFNFISVLKYVGIDVKYFKYCLHPNILKKFPKEYLRKPHGLLIFYHICQATDSIPLGIVAESVSISISKLSQILGSIRNWSYGGECYRAADKSLANTRLRKADRNTNLMASQTATWKVRNSEPDLGTPKDSNNRKERGHFGCICREDHPDHEDGSPTNVLGQHGFGIGMKSEKSCQGENQAQLALIAFESWKECFPSRSRVFSLYSLICLFEITRKCWRMLNTQ